MTPRELDIWFDGWTRRRDDMAELMAHFTASLMSVWSKKKVKGTDLYRSRSNIEVAEIYISTRKRQFEEALKLMGPERYPLIKRKTS